MPRNKTKPSKKFFGITLDPAIMKDMRLLAIGLDRFTNELIEEAMKDLLVKYQQAKK